MYEGNCYYPIRTPPNQLYPFKQPYSLIIPQQITYKHICHHASALHHVKIKFTKVWLTQALLSEHTRHFHGNIYTHRAEGYIKIYGVIKWTLAYVNNNNVRVAAKPHAQVTVNLIMVLLYNMPMDKEPTEIYN